MACAVLYTETLLGVDILYIEFESTSGIHFGPVLDTLQKFYLISQLLLYLKCTMSPLIIQLIFMCPSGQIGGHEVKGQGHARPKIDLEVW